MFVSDMLRGFKLIRLARVLFVSKAMQKEQKIEEKLWFYLSKSKYCLVKHKIIKKEKEISKWL